MKFKKLGLSILGLEIYVSADAEADKLMKVKQWVLLASKARKKTTNKKKVDDSVPPRWRPGGSPVDDLMSKMGL